MSSIKLGKYKHFKGKYYQVIGFALHTETGEKLVLFKALYEVSDLKAEYGEEPIFARPYKMFVENVTVDGKETPRFEYIK